jgi:beta-lactamase regulating signal transducer with metallopeptidase domain
MVELALRSTAILASAWLLTRLMPRASAATRHLVWHCALVATLVSPLLAPLVPRFQFVAVPAMPVTPAVQGVADAIESLTAPLPLVAPNGGADRRGTPVSPAPVVTWPIVGLLGTAGTGLWFLAGWFAAIRLVRRSTPAPLSWEQELNAMRERLRVGRSIRLRMLHDDGSALAAGLRSAAILLPRSAAAWSAERRRAVLLHELAHIRRNDCRVQLFAQAACALYWFTPMVWIAAAHLRRERERACDDEVLRMGAQPSTYAADLLEIARELRRPALAPSAALAMARPSELEGRLLAVLAAGRARVPARGSRSAIVLTLAAITTVALGASASGPHGESAVVLTNPGTPFRVTHATMASPDSPAPDVSEAERTLERSDDPHDREMAVLALAFTSGRDVIPALLEALKDPDAQVREKAAIGLALRRDPRVIDPLIAAMSDPDSQVREKAAIALGTSGDARAADVLTRALRDPDSQVREKAVAALSLLGLTR